MLVYLRRSVYLVTLTLALAAGHLAAAGDPDTPDGAADLSTVFQDQVQVEVVSIDVVVLDKEGRAVTGLDASDFVLRVDGDQVDIANFYASSSRSVAAETVSALPSVTIEEAVPEDDDGAIEATPEVGHVVVFFDNFRTAPKGRERVLHDLPPFLEQQLANGNRVMLAAFDQTGATILAPFTDDLATLQSALAQTSEPIAWGMKRHIERKMARSEIASIYRACEGGNRGNDNPCTCVPRMASVAERSSAEIEGQKKSVLTALNNLVGALGSLQGRKSLLYVSDGVELQSGLDLFHYIEDLCPSSGVYQKKSMSADGLRSINQLMENANANRVTFYNLQASGPPMGSHASAEFAGGMETPSMANDRVVNSNLQDTIVFMARETGGRAILNATHFDEGLADIDHEMQSFYSLGFSPDHEAAGKPHRVKVKVPEHKVEVRYRRSFVHKEADQTLAERALGAFLFGVEQNPLLATVRSGPSSLEDDGSVLVPIEVSVPFASLALLPTAEERVGQLTLIVAAPNVEGKKASIRKMSLQVQAPLDETAGPEDYRIGVRLRLPPGKHEIGVGLWDDIAQTASILQVSIDGG